VTSTQFIATGKNLAIRIPMAHEAWLAVDSSTAHPISLISINAKDSFVANLLVRGVDDTVVRALKERAGAHGRSAEAEHREILAAALVRPRRRSLADVLKAMPNVGTDADFERPKSDPKAPRVFG